MLDIMVFTIYFMVVDTVITVFYGILFTVIPAPGRFGGSQGAAEPAATAPV
jgi:hypothetical protein